LRPWITILSNAGRCTRGVILQISLDPALGHEIKKSRPCLVVQNDVGNKYSPMTVVVPIEGAEHVPKLYPVNVFIPAGEGGLDKTAWLFAIKSAA